MKILCSYIGGSHLYGLETPESDKDERFVFLNTEPKYILGLEKYENSVIQNKTQDKTGKELRHFFALLRKGNTESIEALFVENFLEVTPEFLKIKTFKSLLIDQKTLFKSLLGYVYGEKKVMFGTTSGPLGEKRKSAIEKYGYSNRNAVHALRLLHCGITFFKTGHYPLNIKKHDKTYWEFLYNIKVKPGDYKPDELLYIINKKIEELKTTHDSIDRDLFGSRFDEEYANDCLRKIYLPFLS